MQSEIPILYSPPMVQATIAGRKTKTRRAIRIPNESMYYPDLNMLGFTFLEPSEFNKAKEEQMATVISCPYGKPGDLLWVREEHYSYGQCDCDTSEWFHYTRNDFADFPAYSALESFISLWSKINGPESWAANPWVWVVEFELLSTTGKPSNL